MQMFQVDIQRLSSRMSDERTKITSGNRALDHPRPPY
jgi:hypothetical protein